MTLAWGNKVSPEFRALVVQIAAEIGCDPSHLMACMAFESHLDPAAVNPVSNATGLIQFMPGTARDFGTTVEALASMTAVEQLRYVLAYFRPYAGKLHTLSDVYMAILWPAAVGKDEDYVLFAEPTRAYSQNKGLDLNGDGKITKGEATAFPARRLTEGLEPPNVWQDTATPAVAPSSPPAGPTTTISAPTGGTMDPLSLISLLTSVFSPLLKAKLDKVVGTAVGQPLVDGLLAAAQQLTGKADPLEAVAVARQTPAVVTQLEQKTEDWFAQIAPAIDKIAALERGEWDAEESSRTAAADRGLQMQSQGPLAGNPQFLIALMIIALVCVVVFSVLWKDAVLAAFIGKEALGEGGAGFSRDMQAFVIGAIVGSGLTAIIGYFFGSTRNSAAKDITIDAIARQKAK